MKELFDNSSYQVSKLITNTYSTSFSISSRLLSPRIRKAIYAIYGFVRYADEIVDSFEGYDQEILLDEFETEYYKSIERKISLNPVLNAFQNVIHQYDIPNHLVESFLTSMRMDLDKKEYKTFQDYTTYIYGSADVVGLMCLKVFVNGDHSEYERLKDSSMRLGSAFQKVNFLRDLKDDTIRLERSYFPHIDFSELTASQKAAIIKEIETDFQEAFKGIVDLPVEARLGVYTAYRYYKKLLINIKKVDAARLLETRIRVSNPNKMIILGKSFIRFHLNVLSI